MLVNELYKQVAGLGFEDSLEDDNRFYYAANRALLQVASLRPAISSYFINHQPIKNLIPNAGFKPTLKETELCYEAIAPKAYYFEADGNGIAYIEKKDEEGKYAIIGTVTLDSHRTFKAYKGFIRDFDSFVTGNVRIRFSGEYLYSVKNVAMFGQIYSDNADDIQEYTPFVGYDISALAPDFLSLSSPPIADATGEQMAQGYKTEGGKIILLPYEEKGCFKILYRRKPSPIRMDEDAQENNDEIDMDEEMCALLPNLVASYIWAEDEPSLAQYYLMLYQTSAADIERRTRNTAPVAYKNTNGW